MEILLKLGILQNCALCECFSVFAKCEHCGCFFHQYTNFSPTHVHVMLQRCLSLVQRAATSEKYDYSIYIDESCYLETYKFV